MTSIDIQIGGVDYSKYLTLPLVIQDTGTEELDTAIVELHGMPTEARFTPFTPVKMCGGKYEYIVANDAVKEVFGRKRWSHEITLMHPTKNAERVLMEAKAFTQPLVHDYADGQTNAPYIYDTYSKSDTDGVESGVNSVYSSPIKLSSKKVDIAAWSVAVSLAGLALKPPTIGMVVFVTARRIRVLYDSRNTVFSNQSTVLEDGLEQIALFEDVPENDSFSIDVNKNGVYTIAYDTTYRITDSNNVSVHYDESVYYPISVVNDTEDKETAYTLREATDILLECAEPLRMGEKPRFSLSLTDAQEDLFQNTTSPEFHFPNGRSLLENLSVIGGYIHAIPRVSLGGTVTFRDIGNPQKADLSKGERFAASGQSNAADYAQKIEANFSNLINIDDESEGSVDYPYKDGYITFRSDDARIKEETGKIKLPFPCEKVLKITVRYEGVDYDITKYLFEKNEYDLLSSYSGVFPFTKTMGLFYSQGGTEIEGFWYRAEDKSVSIFNSFQKYAIANILSDVSNREINIDNDNIDAYLNLLFRVSYVPIINGRARQQRTDEAVISSIVLAHNQSANKMSARAFGENLRGKVDMLTGATDSVSYMFRSLEDVPKPWSVYDDRYISSVTTRVYPHFCISELALTPNYNALGQYTEVKTAIRQYEIPAAETRHTLLEEYCVIGTREEDHDSDALCQPSMREEILRAFTATEGKDLTSADLTTQNEDGVDISRNIVLPIFSTSLGNSIYFGIPFADNFSAGVKSVGVAIGLGYRVTDYVPYGDPFYSRAKYLGFRIRSGHSTASNEDEKIKIANALPSGSSATGAAYISTGDKPLILNKDSADACNIGYQMHFVSDDGMIIGAGFTRMIPLVRSSWKWEGDGNAAMVLYDAEVNGITGKPTGRVLGSVPITIGFDKSASNATKWRYKISTSGEAHKDQKAWAIVRYGQVLIAKNSTEIPKRIYLNFKSKMKGV